MRKIWLVIHRWLGLTVGLVFVLIGLTGSLLVFDHAIDEWLNPELLLTQGSGQPRSVAQVIDAAESAYNDSAKPAVAVSRPRVENGVWTVWFSRRGNAGREFVGVHVDPYSGVVTGQRVWGQDLMSWIYRLHYQLVAGRIGSILVGSIGVIVLVSIATGIVLWWPLWKHSWRAAFAVRRGRRFNYDLHKTIGIVSAALLTVVTFTGVYMEFPGVFTAAAKTFAAVTEPDSEMTSKNQASKQPLSPDQAIEIAKRTFPGATFDHLHPPSGDDGTYEVAFRQSNEVQQSFGRSQVFLDQYTGEVLDVRSPAKFTAADAFFAWQFPLHNGEAFGLAGRWVILVLGLSPAILYFSGAMVWWRKRRPKRLANRQGVDASKITSSANTPAAKTKHQIADLEPVLAQESRTNALAE
ncbi:PepSY domain-containing protein [Stieleria sp. TO1_6]|uniref:PepSY-associated TM helix domain-containing protein n=1 Tax=Stieleria tagensis TaxID=2956795 RepID=UPI00209BB4DA|nr:PepSY-associated TM helix domain-containing protein [Stieleria tagensis]MCO8122834.1 PepSY domain-containing protein [Stieleria tagensis]